MRTEGRQETGQTDPVSHCNMFGVSIKHSEKPSEDFVQRTDVIYVNFIKNPQASLCGQWIQEDHLEESL